MEKWQVDHITEHLVMLTKNTLCTVLLLTKLKAKNVISEEEFQELNLDGTIQLQKAAKLYSILKTRKDSYSELIQALEETAQSGAAEILKNYDIKYQEIKGISYDENDVLGTGSNGTKVYAEQFGGRDVAFKVQSKQLVHPKNTAFGSIPQEHLANKTDTTKFNEVAAIEMGNLLLQEAKANDIPLVQFIPGTTKCILDKPYKRALMKIRCTGKRCHPIKEYEWRCNKCMTLVEYDFDDHVYCGCGSTPAICMEFKCTDPTHGHNFQRHNEVTLTKILNQLRPVQPINILLLGEFGVGKSTWINAFANYISHSSFDEAGKGNLFTLIPSTFSALTDNFEEVVISTGTDDNEKCVADETATQAAKVHRFNVGNLPIQLIDTPGIGDTRGVEQDRKNFENVLGTLSHLEEIHGICILLKPNNARLKVVFRYCITELLTYFHRDAIKNIMFCFTNSRNTLYRPGDTLPDLQKLLTMNREVEIPVCSSTVYCYDSEAYRFLAAVKNKPPAGFSEVDRLNFPRSWEKSIEETKRMLKHIEGLKPHNITSTLNLNHSRKLVLKLYRPLSEIRRNIQINKAVMEDKIAEIQLTDGSIKNLEGMQTLSDKEKKAKAIEAKRSEIQELEDELKTVEEASVRYAYFLKKNAITPYNDAMEQYLNHLIREEEAKVGCGGSETALKRLTESRDSYVLQKNILEKQMNSGDGEKGTKEALGASEVDLLVKKLQGFKYSGEQLRQALECIEYTQNAVYQETVMKSREVTGELYSSIQYRSSYRLQK